jgi:hypothetical protein
MLGDKPGAIAGFQSFQGGRAAPLAKDAETRLRRSASSFAAAPVKEADQKIFRAFSARNSIVAATPM